LDSVSLGMSVVEITWLNILLSGDNALVIALACRQLNGRERKYGIVFGAGAAVVLRIIFTAGVSVVLNFPFLRVVGGILLLWIAVRLLVGEEADDDAIAGHSSLWRAVWTIIVADVVMSLDNVLAIAAAAHGSQLLIILGLAISIPIVVMSSTLIVSVLNRLPILVWAGGGFLGWIAGEMMAADETAMEFLHLEPPEWTVAMACVLLVLAAGWWINRRRMSAHAPQVTEDADAT
jgi:YjbE family integral membrane protein